MKIFLSFSPSLIHGSIVSRIKKHINSPKSHTEVHLLSRIIVHYGSKVNYGKNDLDFSQVLYNCNQVLLYIASTI